MKEKNKKSGDKRGCQTILQEWKKWKAPSILSLLPNGRGLAVREVKKKKKKAKG